MRLMLESKETKVKPETTIQLVKPRFPPLWSGQEYDKWRVEVEKWFDKNKSLDKRSI